MTLLYRGGIDATAITTNATPTEILSYIIPTGQAIYVEVLAVASSASGNDCAAWKYSMMYKRDGSGAAVTLLGSIQNIITPITTLGAVLWSTNLVLTGNVLSFQVTGALLTTINWQLDPFIIGIG